MTLCLTGTLQANVFQFKQISRDKKIIKETCYLYKCVLGSWEVWATVLQLPFHDLTSGFVCLV